MACGICGHEGHNRSTCWHNPEVAARRWAAAQSQEDSAAVYAARRRGAAWKLGVFVVLAALYLAYCAVRSSERPEPVAGVQYPAAEPAPTASARPRQPLRPRRDAGAVVRGGAGWIEPPSPVDAGR